MLGRRDSSEPADVAADQGAGVVGLQNAAQQRRGGGFTDAAGDADDAPGALAHEQVQLAVQWHPMRPRQLQIRRGERHGGIDEHAVGVDEIAVAVLAQHEADGQALQRLQGIWQGGGVFQIGHCDRGTLLGEIAGQTDPAAE